MTDCEGNPVDDDGLRDVADAMREDDSELPNFEEDDAPEETDEVLGRYHDDEECADCPED